jgi:TonB family protein
MKIEKEEFILISILAPLILGLTLLLTSVKAPSELFTLKEKRAKEKLMKKIEVKVENKELPPKVETLPSLSQTLAPPSPSLGGDLKSLSAGLVAEGNGGSGGMNVTQGEAQTTKLLESTEGQSRPARAIQVVNPTYPQSAQARGIEGHVILEVLISVRGQVMEAKVLSAEPQGLFEQVAIEAIKKWTFEPGLQDGKTATSRIKQKVNFELN